MEIVFFHPRDSKDHQNRCKVGRVEFYFSLNRKPKICYTVLMPLSLLSLEFALPKIFVVLAAVAVLTAMHLTRSMTERWARYALGVVIGTILSFGLMKVAQVVMSPETPKQGQAIAVGVFFLFLTWRLLFGPWDSRTKATVFGTFLFWILVHMLAVETPAERIAHLIAIGTALVPAVVWCLLFLPYHTERLSIVFCMLFAGMLATIPILFYDALVNGDAELHFFLFRVAPDSFNVTVRSFVDGEWPGLSPLPSTLLTMVLSFTLVGILEEGSKLWVLWRAGRQYTTSIDDMMQMAVLVAIGFAFAENVTSSGYFLKFVREFLLTPGQRNWAAFFGNVAGRSILTSMVHIVSTGLMGYYVGLALYGGRSLQSKQIPTVRYRLLQLCHDFFALPQRFLYRRLMILTGLAVAIFLHALSNFLVSLPDALPGNPRTLGDLLNAGPDSPLRFIALLLPSTLLYVVGGFSLLTYLFQRKENMKEMGHIREEGIEQVE